MAPKTLSELMKTNLLSGMCSFSNASTRFCVPRVLVRKKSSRLIHYDFPYIILRPSGVYGPRERDYFLMAKSISQHIDFAVGFKRQDITFVYVEDVVQAVFLLRCLRMLYLSLLRAEILPVM